MPSPSRTRRSTTVRLGFSIEDGKPATVWSNRLGNNGAEQLLVLDAGYVSDRNCFEAGGPEQFLADFFRYPRDQRFKSLREYQDARQQDLGSRENGCGPWPEKPDVHRMHADSTAYLERALKALESRVEAPPHPRRLHRPRREPRLLEEYRGNPAGFPSANSIRGSKRPSAGAVDFRHEGNCMNPKRLLLPALVLLALAPSRVGFSQTADDSVKKDIQALKEGQQAIQKDLQEIKKLLASRPAAGAPTEQAVNAIISVEGEPFRGDKNAKLTLVEFSEFQCPFCGRHVRDTVPQLDKEYIQTGKVKYVFADLPLESIHKNAFKASEAAHCAGEQNKYWEMHDRLFANQNSLEPAMLTAHAQAVGADTKKFQACLDSGKYAAEIRKNIAEANKYGITGTPTSVIGLTQPNDPKTIKVLKVIRGAQNIGAFKEALDSLYNEKPAVEKKAEKQ